MIRPIGEGRHLTWKGGQLTFEKIAEGLTERINVNPIAIHKIHRHIERILHPCIKAKTLLKHKGQHPRARGIEVTPDTGAP